MKKKAKIKNLGTRDLNFKNGEVFQRMNYLMNLSSQVYSKFPSISKVYSFMIKDISKRNAIRIESKIKKLICQNCNNLIFFDKNTKLELKNKSGKQVLIIECCNEGCHNKSEIILF